MKKKERKKRLTLSQLNSGRRTARGILRKRISTISRTNSSRHPIHPLILGLGFHHGLSDASEALKCSSAALIFFFFSLRLSIPSNIDPHVSRESARLIPSPPKLEVSSHWVSKNGGFLTPLFSHHLVPRRTDHRFSLPSSGRGCRYFVALARLVQRALGNRREEI